MSLKGQPSGSMVEGSFFARVVVDDSLWTVEDGELVITLQKENTMQWWKCVILGDPEIDTQKVKNICHCCCLVVNLFLCQIIN